MTALDTNLTVKDKCSICFENISEEESKNTRKNECGHQCCHQCLIKYLKMEINEKHLKIKCFSLRCKAYLSEDFIKSSLANDRVLLNQYIKNFQKKPVVPLPQINVYINNAPHSKKCCECEWVVGDCNRIDMFCSIINYLDEPKDICRIVIANILVFFFGSLFLYYYNYSGAFGRESWKGCKMYFLNFFGIIMGFSYFITYIFYWFLLNIIVVPLILYVHIFESDSWIRRGNLGFYMILVWYTEYHDDD